MYICTCVSASCHQGVSYSGALLPCYLACLICERAPLPRSWACLPSGSHDWQTSSKAGRVLLSRHTRNISADCHRHVKRYQRSRSPILELSYSMDHSDDASASCFSYPCQARSKESPCQELSCHRSVKVLRNHITGVSCSGVLLSCVTRLPVLASVYREATAERAHSFASGSVISCRFSAITTSVATARSSFSVRLHRLPPKLKA